MTSMTAEYFDLGEKLLGLERPPVPPRHFLPPVVGDLRTRLFDGYADANVGRYSFGRSRGNCLDPDLPAGQVVAIDPDLPVRSGDVGLIAIEMQGHKYECLKHVQARDGRLWACSNDGDLPLSGHVRAVGRLVYVAGPISASDAPATEYHQGLSNFFEAMASPKSEGNHLLQSLAGSTVPAGLASLDHATDPYKRTVYSMISAIQARTPGASESLPPQRNLWGEPIKNGSDMGAAYDMFVPASTREAANEPIDKELLKQGINLSKVASRTSFDGATIDLHKSPEVYSRYQELAGNAYKDPAWGGGAKDVLNQIVSGNHDLSPVYERLTDGPDGGKATMIRDLLNRYRDGAKEQLLQEFPQLRAEVDRKRQAQAQAAIDAMTK